MTSDSLAYRQSMIHQLTRQCSLFCQRCLDTSCWRYKMSSYMLKYVEYVFLSAPQDKRVLLIMAHAGLGRKVEGKCIIYHMLPEVALEAVSLLGIMMAP